MATGIKISLPDQDATNAPERSLVFYSEYYTLKQKKFISFPTTVTITAGDFNNTVTFTHNLGYNQAYEITCEDTAGRFFRVPGISDDSLTNPTKGIVDTITTNALTSRIGWVTVQGSDYTLKILCKIYIDEELQ